MVASWIEAGAEYFGLSAAANKFLRPFVNTAKVENELLPDTRKPTAPDRNIAIGAALQPKYQIAEFGFRDAEMTELVAWCRSYDRQGWRLIHGETGRGKTRLAIELCNQMRDEYGYKWHAGILTVTAFDRAVLENFDLLLNRSRPTLIVLDYAERHPRLAEMLLHFASIRPENLGKLRLLFITRRDAEMWDAMFRNNTILQEQGRGKLASLRLDPALDTADPQ